jgi:hypothetical protein
MLKNINNFQFYFSYLAYSKMSYSIFSIFNKLIDFKGNIFGLQRISL